MINRPLYTVWHVGHKLPVERPAFCDSLVSRGVCGRGAGGGANDSLTMARAASVWREANKLQRLSWCIDHLWNTSTSRRQCVDELPSAFVGFECVCFSCKDPFIQQSCGSTMCRANSLYLFNINDSLSLYPGTITTMDAFTVIVQLLIFIHH